MVSGMACRRTLNTPPSVSAGLTPHALSSVVFLVRRVTVITVTAVDDTGTRAVDDTGTRALDDTGTRALDGVLYMQ